MGRINELPRKFLISALVSVALQGTRRAITSKPHPMHAYYREGYLEVVRYGKRFTTYKLSRKGENEVLNLPDGYNEAQFPLMWDVDQAKINIRESKNE